jgi:hypothetical protein
MYDRNYEEKTQKSGLRVSKSCGKTGNSSSIVMFTETLNKKKKKEKRKKKKTFKKKSD